jgi:hypothetical protein
MSWLKSTKFWGVVVWCWRWPGVRPIWLKRRSSKPKVQWETTAVDRGRITARVTATGTLSALVTVQVGSQVSGSILKLYADFNSTVKKGQVVAKIDPRLFQATLENARANYAQAKATLDKDRVLAKFADRQFKRQGPLAKDKLIAISDLGHRRVQCRLGLGPGRGRPSQCQAGPGGLAPGRGEPGPDRHRVAHRWHGDLAQRGRGPDRGRFLAGAGIVCHRRGSAQDAGRHQRGRG